MTILIWFAGFFAGCLVTVMYLKKYIRFEEETDDLEDLLKSRAEHYKGDLHGE
jgi:hypothetical protein